MSKIHGEATGDPTCPLSEWLEETQGLALDTAGSSWTALTPLAGMHNGTTVPEGLGLNALRPHYLATARLGTNQGGGRDGHGKTRRACSQNQGEGGGAVNQ